MGEVKPRTPSFNEKVTSSIYTCLYMIAIKQSQNSGNFRQLLINLTDVAMLHTPEIEPILGAAAAQMGQKRERTFDSGSGFQAVDRGY